MVQTDKIDHFPIILYGSEYWNGLLEWMRSRMCPAGAIEEPELTLLQLADNPVEAARLIIDNSRKHGFLKTEPQPH